MRVFVLTVVFFVSLFAEQLKVSDNISMPKIVNQHEVSYDGNFSKNVIFTWDKESTQIANNVFDSDKNLTKESMLIVDVSQTPSMVMSFFVLPKFKEYTHDIYLSYDEKYNVKIPYKDGCLTSLHVEKNKIKDIKFPCNEEELIKSLK
jgi:hypothetical protein